MVDEIEENRALVLRFDGPVDLTQFTKTNDEFRIRLDLPSIRLSHLRVLVGLG
jgi:hypothetical protein